VKHPQIVVLGLDDWLAAQLRELAAGAGWVLHDFRQAKPAAAAARGFQPTVVLLQTDPHTEPPAAFPLLSEIARANPDAACIVVADVKLNDDDRGIWTAAAFDLGAKYALFPPLTRPVLEDIVNGLMTAAIRRTSPAAGGTIDLAAEGLAE
jgi:hypothetical protein